jgi:ABC-type enterobactin transport system permease subunit
MPVRSIRMPIALVAIGVLVLIAAGAAGQTTAPVARTPDGQPDIQGYWTEEAVWASC